MNIFTKLTQQVRHSYLQMSHCYFLILLMKINLTYAIQKNAWAFENLYYQTYCPTYRKVITNMNPRIGSLLF